MKIYFKIRRETDIKMENMSDKSHVKNQSFPQVNCFTYINSRYLLPPSIYLAAVHSPYLGNMVKDLSGRHNAKQALEVMQRLNT